MSFDDPLGDTRPNPPRWSLDATQPVRPPIRFPAARPRRRVPRSCLSVMLAAALLAVIYFLLPVRTNILILGTDSREAGNPLGRTDTLILATIVPLRPDVAMLSVPRDLWVPISGYGENRINAAFFFAEAEEPGSGVQATIDTVRANFGIAMNYHLLVDFGGLVEVVDAMGGVDVDLPAPMSGYDEGTHHLDGAQALAFVRDRAGTDDFFRMARGQLFVRSLLKAFLRPATWLRAPSILIALADALETDLPVWQWPRLSLAVLRAGPEGLDGRTIGREMAVPFTTAAGASVLLPVWEQINPLIEELFR